MKSIADKPPLARMAFLSIAKTTMPRKKRTWALMILPTALGMVGWVVLLFGIWLAIG